MKMIYALMLLFGSVLLLGCDNSNDPLPLTTLAITPSSVPELPVGGTQPFTATGTDSAGGTYDATLSVSWLTSDANVVTIDALGVATTIAVGTATISATSAGINSNSVELTVATDPVPPPTDTEDYSTENVCRAEFCETDDALSQTCSNFLAACLATTAREEDCVAGSLWICQNPDEDAGSVCTYGSCGTDTTKETQCQQFLAVCANESANAEECVGAMLFFCRPEE